MKQSSRGLSCSAWARQRSGKGEPEMDGRCLRQRTGLPSTDCYAQFAKLLHIEQVAAYDLVDRPRQPAVVIDIVVRVPSCKLAGGHCTKEVEI